jgi:hypothetical protein
LTSFLTPASTKYALQEQKRALSVLKQQEQLKKQQEQLKLVPRPVQWVPSLHTPKACPGDQAESCTAG